MARLVTPAATPEPEEPDVQDFRESVRKYYANGHGKTILFFDQFEDFFASLDSAQRHLFLNGMADLYSNQNLPLHSVFFLREDLLSERMRRRGSASWPGGSGAGGERGSLHGARGVARNRRG